MILITRGIEATIPNEIISKLFLMIDEWSIRGYEMDYLQVFNLSHVVTDEPNVYTIEHHQEQPEYKEVIKIKSNEVLDYDANVSEFFIYSDLI